MLCYIACLDVSHLAITKWGYKKQKETISLLNTERKHLLVIHLVYFRRQTMLIEVFSSLTTLAGFLSSPFPLAISS